jgi:DNA-binding PadR family transcriptional regulator
MLRTLDLFLLTLVRHGINTPYDWQTRAGVSLGASLPAVRRLLSEGLVTEADKGSRGRREFAITRSGRGELQRTDAYLQRALDEADGDLESTLRLACIAVSEGKPEQARKMLLQAADEHAKRSRRARKRATLQPNNVSVAGLYSAALAHCDAIRQDATSKSLISLASVLKLDSDPVSRVRTRQKSTR